MKSTGIEMIAPEVIAYLRANPIILEDLRRKALDVDAHNIEHEETDRKTSGNSDSDNENQAIPRHSLSSMSDSSTGIGNVNIGYDSFLDISSDKNEQGKVLVRIADERLKTWLGEEQGDHVISYEIFLRFCARKINGKSLRDIPHVLNAAFSAIMPSMTSSSNYPSAPELLCRDRVSEGYKGLTEDELDDLNTGRRYKREGYRTICF